MKWRDLWLLSREPKALPPNPRLGKVDRNWIRTALAGPGSVAHWPIVAEEMGKLQIRNDADGVNPGDRRAIYALVRACRPERVLEVGTHVGSSTIAIAAALRDSGEPGRSAARLTTVDIVDVNDSAQRQEVEGAASLSPIEMMTRIGMADRVEFVIEESLKYLTESGPPFDFVFLDGNHGAVTVYRELPAAFARLVPGGLVLLHDYFPELRSPWRSEPVIPGPWLAVERLRREGAAFSVLPLGELEWPTKRGGTATSLALVVGS